MISFTIPGRVKSTANLREHWSQKAKRAKADRAKAMTLCPKWTGPPLLVITLFRYGARELDSDNLASALKAQRDGVSARLGVDDGSRLVGWQYQQATCPFGQERVEVVIDVNGWWRGSTIDIGVGRPIHRDSPPMRIPTPSVYRKPKP